MIYFILGRSGSGKTEYIHQKIQELIENNAPTPVLIFPEQSSYINETRLLKQFGAGIASAVPVQSFSKLAKNILDMYGEKNKKILDAASKAVLMSLAIENVRDYLELFSERCEKNDLATVMLKTVSDYKSCAVTPKNIFDKLSYVQNERLRQKMHESALIYESYDAMVSQSFLDPDDDLTRLYNILLEHDYFHGKTVLIDSFSGFTFQELKILECIFATAEDVYLTLGVEPLSVTPKSDSVFASAEKTLRRLKNICGKQNKQYKTISLTEQYRYNSDNLKAVERLIYRFESGEEEKSDNTVSLFVAEDIYGETEQLARNISSLIYNNGYDYNDIAVICRNIETYAHIIESVFEKYNIPYFMSYPQRLETKPLMRFVIAALEVVLSSFDTESIFVYLKTGLTNLRNTDISLLENYVYTWDIRGKRWKTPFTMNPDGNSIAKADENIAKETENIENIRNAAITPLLHFSERLKQAESGAKMTEAVYKLLEEVHASEQMHSLIYSLNDLKETLLADEEIRLWDLMMDILDSLHNTTENRKMSIRRFSDLLKLAISANDISSIPLTLDHVTIGAANHIRLESPKAIFIIGVMEDVFPALPSENGFYTEAERCELVGLELLLSDTWEEISEKEKYFAYTAVAGASDKLYLSWHSQNTKGERLECSSIIREIKRIIPNLPITTEAQVPLKDKIWATRQTMELSASMWRETTTPAATVRQYFSEQKNTSSFAQSLDSVLCNAPFELSSATAAKKLFGASMQLSASKIESYHLCPFMYFCQYGLKARQREKANLDSRIFGNTVHFVLEKIIQTEGMDTLIQADEKKLQKLIKDYLSAYLKELGGSEAYSERFVYLFERIGKVLTIVLKHLIEEFSQSDFRPVDFELTIGEEGDLPQYTLELPTGETVGISGKIDRVDTFVKDNKKYIRIVDYKTGSKIFSLSDIMYGLNTQMLLYLSAIKKTGDKYYGEDGRFELIPAGVLYMPSAVKYENISVSSLSSRSNGSEQTTPQDIADKEHRSSLKMNGLLIDDIEVLNAMEKECKGIFIPVRQKKSIAKRKTADDTSEEISISSNSLASLERFGKIFSYIDEQIIQMASSLYKGQIHAFPAKGKTDACQYCKYQSVCGYEDGRPCRTLSKKLTSEDIDALLNGEEEGEE